MKKMYVIHIVDDKGKLVNVSYTNEFELAAQYADLHGLSEKHILTMTEPQLDKYLDTINNDEVSVDEIQKMNGLALTLGELEWVSDSAADTVYDIISSLGRIEYDLKYFKGTEYTKLREAIDKFVKNMGQRREELSDRMHSDMRLKKFARNALLDLL